MVIDLLLVGAGHAHLYVVKRAAKLATGGYRVHLVAPRFFYYSGVASASANGALSPDVGRIDVRALAEQAGAELHEDTLAFLDTEHRVGTTSEGVRLSYDLLSLNIGSVVAVGMQVHPTVLRVKPLSDLTDLNARLRSPDMPRAGATVTVVGGGSTGLELSAHLAARGDVATVRLVEAAPRVGDGLPPGARRRVEEMLRVRGVAVRTGCMVSEIDEHGLTCAGGAAISHDLAILATGLRAPPLLSELGLGEHGVPVRATLQHVDRDEIYAAGDCAHFLPRPLPRIGVHGVRQGPVLYRSLLARVRDQPLPTYEPQRRALSILDLGDGVGLAVRGRRWWYGAGPLRLKRYIDRRWLKNYRTGRG